MTDKTFPMQVATPIFNHVAFGPNTVMEGSQTPKSFFSGGFPDKLIIGDGIRTLHWDITFTPEQETEWDDIVRRARRRTEALDDVAMEPYYQTMKQYWQAASPTQAQTAQALKAAIRVLYEMLRDNVE